MSKVFITFGSASAVGPIMDSTSMVGQMADLPDINPVEVDCPSDKSVIVVQPDEDILFASSLDKLAADEGHFVRGGSSFTTKVIGGGKVWLQVVDNA